MQFSISSNTVSCHLTFTSVGELQQKLQLPVDHPPHVEKHAWVAVFIEDVSEEGAAGTEHCLVRLEFETIRGHQSDISEVAAPPDVS